VKANPSFAESRLAIFLAGAAIALAGLIAYQNSFAGAFISDDRISILENPTIRQLWPPQAALSPPGGWSTVSGRPFLNLSFAVNYALSATNPWSYHALNLLIHILAGLTLFGIVRRTLERVGTGGLEAHSSLFAFATAMLWTVHPLQTESVAYVSQRAESLMGLCYLLTLYGFIQYATAEGSRLWASLSILCCLLGMLTKEVMVTAPVIVLLYDRTFVAGSFSEALRRRRNYYAAMAATWLPLAYLVAKNGGNRGGSIGLGADVDAWAYLLSQIPAVIHYLKLSVWPDPLVFDHGLQYLGNGSALIKATIILLPLLAATIVALWKRPALGFLGASFFCILAPSSLMPGTRQSLAEHRMYLPLAPVVVLGMLATAVAWRRWLPRLDRRFGWGLFAVVTAACCALTVRRNADYRSGMSIWSDTAEKQPENGYAQSVYAALLIDDRQTAAGISHYEAAVLLLPANADLRFDLANALVEGGRVDDALNQYDQAVRLKPDFADAQCNWGLALLKTGRIAEAAGHFAEAIRLNPVNPDVHYFLGVALARSGRLAEAKTAFEDAVGLSPDNRDFRYNLNLVLRAMQSSP
jgi:tetratricopeptide (TPR) repeat protein